MLIYLIGSIIDRLATDIPPNGFSARNIDLMALLQTSRTIHAATLSTLYGHITIPHSRIFRKFLTHIAAYPALGTIVRRIDFSHFNPTGAGMTARQRFETPYLLPATLLQCLNLTPNLQEFLAQEHIDDELSVEVLNALFEMPKMKALDFCACSSTGFKNAFEAALAGPLPLALPITRLSLHECTAVSSSAYTSLLPRLTQLTHLDVAHTRITDEALFAIPQTAKLTHLNISRCAGLTGQGVVKFLTTHPAVKELVYLNLACDVKSHELLTADDITALLPQLPTTLRSLNLKGSKMDLSHINLVIPLTKHVEELGLGRHLKLKDLTRLFLPSAPLDTPAEDLEEAEIQAQLEWTPHSLRYIDVSDLNSAELDLSTLFASSCPLLTSTSHPLEVLELSTEVYKKLENSPSSLKRVGWCVKEAGRRGWLVRVKTPGNGEKVDDGSRSWKWGAQFWGGRKIPVARAEVGGMYGHYMFKR